MWFGNRNNPEENPVEMQLIGSPEDMAKQLVRRLDETPDVLHEKYGKNMPKNPGVEAKVVLCDSVEKARFVAELSSLLIGCGYDFRLNIDGDGVFVAIPMKNNF